MGTDLETGLETDPIKLKEIVTNDLNDIIKNKTVVANILNHAENDPGEKGAIWGKLTPEGTFIYFATLLTPYLNPAFPEELQESAKTLHDTYFQRYKSALLAKKAAARAADAFSYVMG